MISDELMTMAVDAGFDAFGRPFKNLDTGGDFVGIWTHSGGSEIDLGGQAIQSGRPARVLAVRSADAEDLRRGSKVSGPDGIGGRVREFRVDATDPQLDGTTRFELVLSS